MDPAAVQLLADPKIAEALRVLLTVVRANTNGQDAAPFPDNRIADAGPPPPTEDPMTYYKWVGQSKPHHKKFRVYFRTAGAEKGYQDFATLAEAETWADQQRRHLLKGGHPIGEELDAYLAGRTDLAPSTVTTARHRLIGFVGARRHVPVEAFPWPRAWEPIIDQARDTQVGVLSSLRGFVGHLRKRGLVKGDVLASLELRGRRRRGKRQARVDEARVLMALALVAGDPEALAVAVSLVFGLRVGEVVELRCRDLDADGALLWVEGTKTVNARRTVEVPAELRPTLQQLAEGQSGDALLFRLTIQRRRKAQDPHKARKDRVTRRLRQLCTAAGVAQLSMHSLRGMHSSLAREAGQTAHAVAAMLGHGSTEVQRRHYLRPGLEREVASAKVRGLLLGPVPTQLVTATTRTVPADESAEGTEKTVRGGGIEPPWLLTASTSS
jgi:integrase